MLREGAQTAEDAICAIILPRGRAFARPIAKKFYLLCGRSRRGGGWRSREGPSASGAGRRRGAEPSEDNNEREPTFGALPPDVEFARQRIRDHGSETSGLFRVHLRLPGAVSLRQGRNTRRPSRRSGDTRPPPPREQSARPHPATHSLRPGRCRARRGVEAICDELCVK
jgi:hypothetical protein